MDKFNKPIIELKNISKSFNTEPILSNFNFTLYDNKFITILGPSGSGKTTIIKLIAGFESLDNGDIFLNGIKVNDLPANKREVNTVFQNYSLFPHMNVYDNIAFGLRMKKKSQDYIDKAADIAIDILRTTEKGDILVFFAGKGEAQEGCVTLHRKLGEINKNLDNKIYCNIICQK